MLDFVLEIFKRTFILINSASVWLIFSYIMAGFLRDVISPIRLQGALGNTKISSLIKVTFYSVCVPICSCGSVPLGISMYYSGAYAGPVLAYLASSPVLNPAAVILSYGLLGKEITIINIIACLLLPIVIGIIGNNFTGEELRNEEVAQHIQSMSLEEENKKSLKEKIISGFDWVINDFGLTLSKYFIFGMIFGGFILTIFPESFIRTYLGNPSLLSMWNVSLLGAFTYVCAVGHIPFIAALIASGASPGTAIAFLLSGAATNIPEIISIGKMIGKRTAFIYTFVITGFAMITGYITNLLLMPNFKPVIEYNHVENAINFANKLTFSPPIWLEYLCTGIVFIFFFRAMFIILQTKYYEFKGRS